MYPQPSEAEVVLHGVLRLNGSKSRGDFQRSPQIGLFSLGETQYQRNPVHMDVYRNEQF
jgi:hypothetical protein